MAKKPAESARYALLDADRNVVNVILWEGDDYEVPAGTVLARCPVHVGPGWRKSGKEWLKPEPEDEA